MGRPTRRFTSSVDLAPSTTTGSTITAVIPSITHGNITPAKGIATGKQDTTALLRQVQEESPTRNPLTKGVTNVDSIYDFAEFTQAEDVDGYVATTFRLTIEQCLKQGYKITGMNPDTVKLVTRQLKAICNASSINLYTLLEDSITGLTKFNNSFIILVRKEYPASKFKSYKRRGKNLKPISGMFYTEPQYMTPEYKNGKLSNWKYSNPEHGAQDKDFKPEDVFHTMWNKKGSDALGTPWILPAIDDIKMLRRLEEFAQLLISKHLFPIYQYKIGTDKNPVIDFDGGTSEVSIVEQQIGDLPQQGCIFTSHRHEIIAIDTKSAIDIQEYIKHFDSRALSSLGLSDIDIGRGNTASKATAVIMNQTRVDRCTRIQRILTEYFNDTIIASLLLSLGLDPLDEDNSVQLVFNPVDTQELRSQEQHSMGLFQNDLITHSEFRRRMGEKPFTGDDWKDTYSNTTKAIANKQQEAAADALEKQKAVTKQATTPANQTNTAGKTKPKVSKNS